MPINRKHAVKNRFLSLRALFIGGFRFLFIALNFYVNDILHQNNANEKKISRSFKSRFFNTIPLAYYELSRLERYLHFFCWASKLRCSSLRIYATGVNLFTVSKFISDYWDPETGADAYPMQRQVFVGVNLTF